jgi:hypothetical protein
MIGENGTTERPRQAVPSILEPDDEHRRSRAILRTEHSHSAEVLPPPLSSDLGALRLSSAGRSMTVDELQAALKGRGWQCSFFC